MKPKLYSDLIDWPLFLRSVTVLSQSWLQWALNWWIIRSIVIKYSFRILLREGLNLTQILQSLGRFLFFTNVSVAFTTLVCNLMHVLVIQLIYHLLEFRPLWWLGILIPSQIFLLYIIWYLLRWTWNRDYLVAVII